MNAIKKRRAGVAVDAGDRSEGAFYCPVQGGGGGAEYSGPASQIAEIVDAFPWPEMKQRFARAVCRWRNSRRSCYSLPRCRLLRLVSTETRDDSQDRQGSNARAAE